MSKKAELLTNAAKIIYEEGMQQLTMDYLAKTSGMTKGGVLYHFDNKANLLYQMNEMAIDTFEKMIVDYEQSLTGSSTYTRAYALATLAFFKRPEDTLLPAVFISSLEDKDSFTLWEKTSKNWELQLANDTGNEEQNLQLKLIADGIWFAILYGANEGHVKEIEKVVRDYCSLLEKGENK